MGCSASKNTTYLDRPRLHFGPFQYLGSCVPCIPAVSVAYASSRAPLIAFNVPLFLQRYIRLLIIYIAQEISSVGQPSSDMQQ